MAIVPCAIINQQIYNFGVKKINAEEQQELLENAAWETVFDNRVHQKSYRTYGAKDGSIFPSKAEQFQKSNVYGYCKSHCCKQQAHIQAVKSVQYGTHVGHYCLKCLSALLVRLRETTLGPKVTINFTQKSQENSHIPLSQLSNYNLLVKFTMYDDNAVVLINNISYNFQNVQNVSGALSIDIIDCCYIDAHSYLYGTFMGVIVGREVCENIVFGKECKSLLPDYTRLTFHAKTIPAGVPGWLENHRKEGEGKIMIHPLCPACAIEAHKNRTPTPLVNELDKNIEELKTEITMWRKECIKLKDENIQLFAEIERLRSAIKN
jgi:hypothetical protein